MEKWCESIAFPCENAHAIKMLCSHSLLSLNQGAHKYYPVSLATRARSDEDNYFVLRVVSIFSQVAVTDVLPKQSALLEVIFTLCDNVPIFARESLKSVGSAAVLAGSGNRPLESRLVKSWHRSCQV